MTVEIPNTDSKDVARMAIAWHIVEGALYAHAVKTSDTDDHVKKVAALFNEAYNAILENERGQAPQMGRNP